MSSKSKVHLTHSSSNLLLYSIQPLIDTLVSLTFQEYCKRYAKPEDIGAPEEISSDDDDDDSMSERGSDSDGNDEIAGKADP